MNNIGGKNGNGEVFTYNYPQNKKQIIADNTIVRISSHPNALLRTIIKSVLSANISRVFAECVRVAYTIG